MARKTRESRLQYGLFATPLEDMIAGDNPVRVIDAFVDAMDLASFGFKAVAPNHMGAASYDPSDLLKIYFYGYFNRIRSSRCLERECARNVEVMWLTGRLTPCYHTISTFRTYKEEKEGKVLHDHRRALVAVFRSFNRFLDRQGLFGKETFAVDGTKIAAQNSKKKNISEDKIARKLERIEGRISEYLEELDSADREAGPAGKKGAIQKAIQELEANKEAVLQLGDMLQAAKNLDPTVTQVSLTDPDARMLPINNEGMMMVAYNVQSTVDGLHCLVADFSVENQKDNYLLAPMGASVKEVLSIDGDIDLLADKGYHSGKGLQECAGNGITTYVAFPEQSYGDRPKGFQKPDFIYDGEKDAYLCPDKKELATSGTWHEKHGRQGHPQGSYRLYRSPFSVCSACPLRDKCLSKSNIENRHGRTIERSEHERATLDNRERLLLNREKYKRRQAIVEHPFGTIKRSWGCYYTLLKRKEKVAGEMAIVFATYNLRRVINIMGATVLINALKGLLLPKKARIYPFCGALFIRHKIMRIEYARGRIDSMALCAAA